ncbi:transmembrane protein [Actinidia rufa]|uniref:Transmembrane protein n=1 Tax=Actinidia rufa TaxID=165716 RepID=A0A7J0GWL2_9ERIC|nr:transmembrane protein [Actinidia rufa]
MAQYRQSGFDRGVHHHGNGSSDHVSIGIRAPPHKQHHNRRLKGRKLSIGAVIVILCLGFVVSVFAFASLSRDTEINDYHAQDDDLRSDSDFLTNVTRTQRLKILKFGHGSGAHGRDSRYWDKDDRRRDEDYSEDTVEHVSVGDQDGSTAKVHISTKRKNGNKKSARDESEGSDTRGAGLYNEVGRDELKTYEAEYEASLKNVGELREKHSNTNQLHNNEQVGLQNEEGDLDDGYDDGIDLHDPQAEDYDDVRHDNEDNLDVASLNNVNRRESSDAVDAGTKDQNIAAEVEEASIGSSSENSSLNSQHSDKINTHSRHGSVLDGQSARRSSSERRPVSKKKPKRRKFSGNHLQLSY